MAAWTKQDTLKLIEIWGEENIQSQLEGCKRNKHVFEKISQKLEENGNHRTLQQCREKIKKLRQEYKKIKDKINKTGEEGKIHLISSWDYYEPLDNILGNKPATHPSIVIDSYAESADVDKSDALDEDTSVASAITSDSEDRQSISTDPDNTKVKAVFSDVKSPVLRKSKKRQIDVLQESFKDVVGQIVEAQKMSDKMFSNLEEKRMKLEEAQQEREMTMRKEDQDFQLRVMQMLSGFPGMQFPYATQSSYYGQDSQ